MVSKYKRKTNRQSWTEQSMQKAIDAVNNKQMGWLKASITFNVPQATLRRRALNKNKKVLGTTKGLGSFKLSLPVEFENQLLRHILDMESRLFGLTTVDVRKLAFELAERSGCQHKFSKEKKIAGWDWLIGFRKRHPQLSLRSPEATSAARAMAFNKPQVSNFFKLLSDILDKEKIDGLRIYNMDESSLTTVQKTLKIFAAKGKKQVGALTSAERGLHVTVVACFSAFGNYVPPALVFPRKRYNPDLFEGAPPGTLALCQDSGYMTGELFVKWMKHFVQYVKPTCEDKVLLLLDGHASHKNIEALEFAKANGVVVLCLPPHCTHRLQPLDVSFFGPLDSYYNSVATKWLKSHPGRTIGLYQISKLFFDAYMKAATVENAMSGFKACGILPLNPHIFPDDMFKPSETTNKFTFDEDLQPDKNVTGTTDDIGLGTSTTPNAGEIEPVDTTFQEAIQHDIIIEMDENLSLEDLIKELSPIPKTTIESTPQRKKRTKGVGDGCTILTTSPVIKAFKARADTNNMPNSARPRSGVTRDLKKSFPNQQAPASRPKDDDADCVYCSGLFSQSKPGEWWLQCLSCHRWCHTACAGLRKSTKMLKKCDLCL